MTPPHNTSQNANSSQNLALSALILLAHFHGVAANPADIAHRFARQDDLDVNEWLLAAKDLGLRPS